MMSKDHKQVLIRSRKEWREWLEKNHTQKESIWLVKYKKGKGPYLSYDDIVEEALCFGWIDSLPRKLDEKKTMLRLSPRKPKSAWSKINKDRIKRLKAEGLMKKAGLSAIIVAKKHGVWSALDKPSTLVMPSELKKALGKGKAKLYFDHFPPSAKRAILEWIALAKRPETKQRRIQKTADLAKKNIIANYPKGRNKGKPLPKNNS